MLSRPETGVTFPHHCTQCCNITRSLSSPEIFTEYHCLYLAVVVVCHHVLVGFVCSFLDQLQKVHTPLESLEKERFMEDWIMPWSQDLKAHLGTAFPSDRPLIQVMWMQYCIPLLGHMSRMLLSGQKYFPVNRRILYFWPLFLISQTSCFWSILKYRSSS